MRKDVLSPVIQQSQIADRRALLVGIDHYDHTTPLHCARKDVEAVRDRLARNEDGTANYACEVPATGGRLTSIELVAACKSLFEPGRGGDIVFYFSGHGVLDSLGGQLVTSDGQEHAWGVSMHHILALATISKARSVVIFLDCCHGGAFGDFPFGVPYGALATMPENVVILAASHATQKAHESSSRGLFTQAVLDALDGAAGDPLGRITPASIDAIVEQRFGECGQQPIYRAHRARSIVLRTCAPRIDPKAPSPRTDADASSFGLRVASTFLCHQGSDRALVYAVARELGQRGVRVWLDRNEDLTGSLENELRAVTAQATMAPFMSEAFAASDGCTRELCNAFDAGWGLERFVPVYLGDDVSLVVRHPVLRARFLHADGGVAPIGLHDSAHPLAPDPGAVAAKIAKATYRQVVDREWNDALVVVDQRGTGDRGSYVPVPAKLAAERIPTLVIRPDIGPRRAKAGAFGKEWALLADRIRWGLSNAFAGPSAGRKLRVSGLGQTGLFWLIGRHFDRTSRVDLYTYGRDGVAMTNAGQGRDAPPRDGDPNAAAPLAPTAGRCTRVGLGVGPRDQYAAPVEAFLDGSMPLFWLDAGYIPDSATATKLVADLVASITRIVRDHGTIEISLFWTTAAHVATLAAANVTSHLGAKIRFMEFDHAGRTYRELPMPDET